VDDGMAGKIEARAATMVENFNLHRIPNAETEFSQFRIARAA
jgi:hypothetical protein